MSWFSRRSSVAEARAEIERLDLEVLTKRIEVGEHATRLMARFPLGYEGVAAARLTCAYWDWGFEDVP